MDERETEDRVRQKAHALWQEHGSPAEREKDYLDEARELVAIEESQRDTLKPNPQREYEQNPTTEPIEPVLAVRNAGEFPTLTDEGEGDPFPSRDNFGEADEPPLSRNRQS